MSNYQNIAKAKAIEKENKKKLLAVNPKLDDESGIYFLTRTDEDNIRHAYIGQAKHILTRLAQHMTGYQYIDNSIKAHGLYSTDNQYGYKVNFLHFPLSQLDEKEQFYIKQYAVAGYQMKNRTAGSQGKGKTVIAECKPVKGYYDGILQGKKILARELSSIAEKHLKIEIREDKKNNKVSQKQFEKFMELMNEDSYKEVTK